MMKYLDHLEEWIITFLMGAATLIIFVAVIHRYAAGFAIPGVQDWLFDELKKHYGVDAVTSVHGDVSLTKRSKLFDSFQNGGSSGFRILLAHPKVASHGLTLTAARTVVCRDACWATS